MQLCGHLLDGNNKKMAGPTISGNFDGTLTGHLEDGSQRKLWEKQYPPTGPGRYSSLSAPELLEYIALQGFSRDAQCKRAG